jgi:Restriction alleviation protein Lar
MTMGNTATADLLTRARKPVAANYLLVCPFCGTRPHIRKSGGKVRVECTSPDCQIHPSVTASSVTAAADQWNQRR